MSDDLDALLADLAGATAPPANTRASVPPPKQQPTPAPKVEAHDELSDLMAELSGLDTKQQRKQSAPPPVAQPKPAPKQESEFDDLEHLMASLNVPPQKQPAKATPPPQPKPSTTSSDLDLDNLMNDLNSVVTNPTPAKTTPTPAPVKTNPPPKTLEDDLGDLMADLDSVVSPPPKSTPAPAPAPTPVKYTPPPAEKDDLAELMADLNSVVAPASKPQASPAPKTTTVQPAAKPPPPKEADDELADLMAGLNAVVAPKPAPQPKPASQPPPKATPVVDDLETLMASLSTGAPAKNDRPAATATKAPPPASSDPLEDLLNQMNPNAAKKPAPATPAKKDDLEDLLGKLNDQLSSDSPSSRGTCFFCNGPIQGEIIQALGKSYHPEHFRCGNCKSPLGTATFYEHEGRPNCEKCYSTLLCPRCAHCDQPILDRCITALGKKWHMNHFVCATCNNPFPNGMFYEKDGKPYCENDYAATFAAKCAGCDKSITGDCINALGQKWHPEHFVCNYCHKPFPGGSFFEYQNKAYCEPHYYQMTGAVCAGCGKPVTGRVLNALDKKWHPEHFMCAFCMAPLAGGLFKEEKGKAYCGSCHQKLFC
ncbi:focal contact protein paxillin [Pelomyxa schiedti]|nr:focal contact protein paxillin [Pelomyxa schiedti]